MQQLRVIAGRRAQQHLLENGLQEADVDMLVGASGGPKWLSLFGIDQFLTGEFFKHRTRPLQLLGSSAGAWRFACYARGDGQAAIEEFARGYTAARFPKGTSVTEVTRASHQLLGTIITGSEAVDAIVSHPVYRLNVIAARSRRLTAARSRTGQMAGLALAALANAGSRQLLDLFFQRTVFHRDSNSPIDYLTDLSTANVALSTTNLYDAVLASGSIPLVLDAVEDIAGAIPGRYFDGGVTDYHFALPFRNEGLVLFPHFYPHTLPGWFDKAAPWRKHHQPDSADVVMICPSSDWVASLPFGKIPDRHDFAAMDDQQREQYWTAVINRSSELADEFDQLVNGNRQWSDYLSSQ